jgi:hypothetical protein
MKKIMGISKDHAWKNKKKDNKSDERQKPPHTEPKSVEGNSSHTIGNEKKTRC